MRVLDPATGKVLWEQPAPAGGCTTGGAAQFPDVCSRALPAAASSSPALVEGGGDGKLRAHSARTGEALRGMSTTPVGRVDQSRRVS